MARRNRQSFAFNPNWLQEIPQATKFSQGVQDEVSYDEDVIVTKSTAEDHQWAEARFKYPGDWNRAIQSMIQRRLIPDYETMADFYRDALYHRLHWVAHYTHDGKLSETSRMLLLKQELDASLAREKRAAELFENLKARILSDVSGGLGIDHEELGRWRRYIEGFDPKYRDKLLTFIDTYYQPEKDNPLNEEIESPVWEGDYDYDG